MTAKIRVPFGIRAGMLVEPSSVANGKSCNCVCPGCGRSLIAYNQGTKRLLHYFGHQPGEDCLRAVESAIHLAGKEVLLREKRMHIPALQVSHGRIALASDRLCSGTTFEHACLIHYDWVESEVSLIVNPSAAPAPKSGQVDMFAVTPPDSFAVPGAKKLLRADIRAERRRYTAHWIEIRVSHAVNEEKKRMFQQAGCKAIEVDLSRFLRGHVTLDDVRRAVVDDVKGKTWLAHPALPTVDDFEESVEQGNVYLNPGSAAVPAPHAVETPLLPPNWRDNLPLQKHDPCLRPTRKTDTGTTLAQVNNPGGGPLPNWLAGYPQIVHACPLKLPTDSTSLEFTR